LRTVLVTGGAGFIGSHLVDELPREPGGVTVADNVDPFHDPVLKRRNIAEHPEHPLYRFVDVEIRDGVQLDAPLTGAFDVIVHPAARPGVLGSDRTACALQRREHCGDAGHARLRPRPRHPAVRVLRRAVAFTEYPAVPWREDRDALVPLARTPPPGQRVT